VRRLERFVEKLETTKQLTQLTCRTIKLDLKPKKYGPREVKKVRELLGASQPIFAQFLGVSPSSVRDWEQGLKPPGGAVCRLMDEITVNPAYFAERLQALSVPVSAD
jgi:putative transcriptional regulator